MSSGSVRSLTTPFQIGDISLRWGEMDKKVGNDEIWANFDHLQIYLRVAPTNLKPVLYTPFQGLLLGKVWTTPPTLTNFDTPCKFTWGSPKKF